jgi:hypothetical protein
MTTFYVLVGLLIVFVGGSLLFYLGAGRVPPPITPVSNLWVRAGYDPKWVTVALWTTFAMVALVFFLCIGIPLYHAVVDLGTPRR